MTNEMTATSIMALFETTKDQRATFIQSILDQIGAGNVDPLKLHLQIKCMEEIIKQLNTNTVYRSSVLEAAEKYGEKSFSFNNAKVEIKEVGVKYDFSKCGDLFLDGLYKQEENVSTTIKARQDMLKTIPQSGMVITDHETGETYTVYPPAKSSTTSVAITLK